jgi:amino acid transporter
MLFTFIVMLGGNPLHDRFGFRFWQNPGPWVGNTAPTRLQSFVNGVNVAGYCIGGPEYLSMVAGESNDPRRVIPRAFKTIIYRLILFCIGGCICVGILVPSNDPKLTAGTGGFAGGSPYVIAMQRLNIPIMPSIVTCCLLTFVVSGGINFTFNASRALHALALDGQAPKFLRRLNRHGVPDMAVIVVILLSCLAYLALGSGSAEVLNWLLNFSTASAMFYWTIMSMTWIRFNSAMKAQGIDRKAFLPTHSRWQPFAGYWAFGWSFLFLWLQGYAVFLHGNWQVSTFIFNYGIIAFAAVIGIAWKLVKRTRFHRSKEIDLHSGLDFFEALTEHYRREREDMPQSFKDKVLAKLF